MYSWMESYSAQDSNTNPSRMVTDRSIGGAVDGCLSDEMVNIEIQAAEALAGLAHSASWGVNEDEWSRGRLVETDSVPLKSGTAAASDASLSMLLSSGKNGPPPIAWQHYQNEDYSMARTTNGERDIKLSKSNMSTGKSRQKLTESEKEARRVHRVMANRESARETIRRRQAHSKELMEKAASLALENEHLKKDKELVNQEYDKLKSINKSLKLQISIEENVEETNVEPKSILPFRSPKTSTSQTASHPPFLYNPPPFFWPPFIQLSNGSQNDIAVRPTLPIHNVSSEQENNGPGIALCVYPCTWFMPPPTDHENLNHPLSLRLDTNSRNMMQMQNMGIETEVVAGKNKTMEQRDKASDCSTSKTIYSFPGKKQPVNSSVVINARKRSEAAAEARKMRKELTKLKSQHFKRAVEISLGSDAVSPHCG